ncbi:MULTISPECIES: ATP-grasp fold amidoligase family protein [Mesorhizobium]|uniref:ATP-grasp domain-containing protein n=6 Tax=Mesorhizobium TaxID=68287 RepID=A0AB38T9B9_9HYPH|nr:MULTISPECIES: ATP-grasp fold amidoligase family protein [Mesorhizobium]MDF3214144.1 ATP-grasp fold amidoligase family protein [Mesorhizobium ciceri]UTU51363.1 hypothetical protein LRP29_28505 [Mesorhizobium ciceri]
MEKKYRKLRRAVWETIYRVSLITPNFYVLNYPIAAAGFFNGNNRFPRRVSSQSATINDFIFDRMIRNRWGYLEKICVDKHYAKYIASGIAGLKIPKTISVFKIDRNTTADDILLWIQPFLGRHFVMKPTHSSGKIIFLDKPLNRKTIEEFLNFSKRSYFNIGRETQYYKMEKKLIVEDNISTGGELSDYKFFCVRGKAIYLQVDVGRFVDHKRAVFSLPDFKQIDVMYGYELPENVERPENLEKMIEIAETISRDVEFVRVDLYSINGDIYFGEMTFSPCAGSDHISNESWAIDFLNRIKAESAPKAAIGGRFTPQAARSFDRQVGG